jgi:thiol-disulfide isomerase/thioredoxin
VVYDDYSKSKNYLLKVSRENFKLKKKKLLELVETLKIQYKRDFEYLEKTNYNVNLIKLQKEKLQNELFTKLLILNNLSNEEAILKFLSSETFINDSLPNNTYGQSFILFYLRKTVIKKPIEYSGGKDYVDYKEAFDNASKYLKDDLLKYARFLSIKSMVSYDEPDREIKKRYVLFKNLYNDKRLISILDDTYLLNIDKEKISNTEIQLLTPLGKKLNFTDVLKSLEGNIVYVDFWASWCAPCRDAMPSSLALNEEYKNKGVKFIYLSVDKDLEKWKNAATIEKLDKKEHNYLVINQENDFMKNINFNLIPRYLVFDKNGVLIFENAPGPEGSEIRRLFNKYLSK